MRLSSNLPRRQDPAREASPEDPFETAVEPVHGQSPLEALIADTAESEVRPARFDRRALAALVVVLAAAVIGTVFVATSLFVRDPNPLSTGNAAGASVAAGSVAPAKSVGHQVAGSRALALDFDTLPTESVVQGWTVTSDDRLNVAAVPTAVDRSARLEGGGDSAACHPIGFAIGTFEATFMVDTVSAGGLALAIDFDDGSVLEITVADSEASMGEWPGPVAVDAGDFYRWEVSRAAGGYRATLFDEGGDRLAVAEAVPGGEHATAVCMSVIAPARAYLDELRVETPR